MNQHDNLHPVEYIPSTFQITTERQYFFQFFVGILLCINNGACFCFALFSDNFRKAPFHFTQSEISTIATVGILLSYFSFPTGFLYDQKGPRPTIIVGTVLNACGWLGLAILFRSSEVPRSLISVIFCYGISQLSASFFETSAMLTNLKAFSCYQGRVVLIQKTFMGLGTSLIAQIYFIFFQSSSTMTPFFVFLFIYSAVVGALSFNFIALPNKKNQCVGLNVMDEDTLLRGGGEPLLFKTPFNIGSAFLIFSVVAVLSMSFIENCFDVGVFLKVLFGIVTLGLPFSFLSMAITTPSYTCNINGYQNERDPVNLPCDDCTEERDHPEALCQLESDANTPVVLSEEPSNTNFVLSLLRHAPKLKDPINLNEQTLWHNIHHRDIWLLWLSCFASWSAMTLVQTNCSQIYQSVSKGAFSPVVNAVYVSIFGVASAMGRIGIGFVHPMVQRQKVVITFFSCVAPILNCIGMPLFLCVSTTFLFLPYFIVGLATGVSWGSTILIITAVYAPQNCGKHYSFLYTAGMLSPIVFNSALFGPIYDHYSKAQGLADDRVCKGVVCIWVPIFVCFCTNCLAFASSCYLTRRTLKNRGV